MKLQIRATLAVLTAIVAVSFSGGGAYAWSQMWLPINTSSNLSPDWIQQSTGAPDNDWYAGWEAIYSTSLNSAGVWATHWGNQDHMICNGSGGLNGDYEWNGCGGYRVRALTKHNWARHNAPWCGGCWCGNLTYGPTDAWSVRLAATSACEIAPLSVGNRRSREFAIPSLLDQVMGVLR